MNIGQASAESGLTPKTIRYYESINLIVARRKDNGYRDYSTEQVQKLKFIQRARALGFSVQECRDLISIYDDQDRDEAQIEQILMARLQDIDAKLQELQRLRETLSRLTDGTADGALRPAIMDDRSSTDFDKFQ